MVKTKICKYRDKCVYFKIYNNNRLCKKQDCCLFQKIYNELYIEKQKLDKIKDIILQCRNCEDCNDCKYADECDNYPSNSEMMLNIIEG